MRVLFAISLLVFIISGCGGQPPAKPTFDELLKQKPRFEIVSQTKEHIFYLDNQSITVNKDKTIASFWLKVELSEDGLKKAPTTYDGKLAYMMNFNEILIDHRKLQNIEYIFYSKENAVLDSIKNPQKEWVNIIPNSVGENIYNAVMRRLKENNAIK